MSGKVYFVSGIDTEIGKTVVTGWLARQWLEQGGEVITQKLVQTGCAGASRGGCSSACSSARSRKAAAFRTRASAPPAASSTKTV